MLQFLRIPFNRLTYNSRTKTPAPSESPVLNVCGTYAVVLGVYFVNGRLAYVIVRENLTRVDAQAHAEQIAKDGLKKLLPKDLPARAKRLDLKVVNMASVRKVTAR